MTLDEQGYFKCYCLANLLLRVNSTYPKDWSCNQYIIWFMVHGFVFLELIGVMEMGGVSTLPSFFLGGGGNSSRRPNLFPGLISSPAVNFFSNSERASSACRDEKSLHMDDLEGELPARRQKRQNGHVSSFLHIYPSTTERYRTASLFVGIETCRPAPVGRAHRCLIKRVGKRR